MSNYQLQLPISKGIKDSAEQKAKAIGIGNINDLIRFLLINFCENRVSINITSNNSENLLQRQLLTPMEISNIYNGLSYCSNDQYHFIYEANNFSSIKDLISLQTKWNKFLKYIFKFNSPHQIIFILLRDSSLLKKVSYHISGKMINLGIDPIKNIVYVNISEDKRSNISILRKESSKLYFLNNVKSDTKPLFVTEYLPEFFRYYGEEFGIEKLLKYRKEDLSAIKKINLELLEKPHENLNEQNLYISACNIIYAQIYNKVGIEKFVSFIRYHLKYPEQKLLNIYKDFFKKDLIIS